MFNYEEYYEDINIYKNIIYDYNIEKHDIFYDMYLELLHNIYTLKILINKNKSDYIKNINKINKINNDFIYFTNKWTLNDSCNKKLLKTKIITIKKNYKELNYLNLSNNNILNNIQSHYSQIENLILDYKSNINNKYLIKNITPTVNVNEVNNTNTNNNVIEVNNANTNNNVIEVNNTNINNNVIEVNNTNTNNNNISNNTNNSINNLTIMEDEDLHMNSIINY